MSIRLSTLPSICFEINYRYIDQNFYRYLLIILQSQPDELCPSSGSQLDRGCVVSQLRSLQVLETLHVMAATLPHRYRYRPFNQRYRMLIRSSRSEGEKPAPHVDKAYTETKVWDKSAQTLNLADSISIQF